MNPQYVNIGANDDKVIEECAEVIQAIIKAKRFGIDGEIPGETTLDEQPVTNRMRIIAELADLERAIMNYMKELFCNEVVGVVYTYRG
ncbi:MAG TPA: hypothetical protein PK705_07755 [Clostridia bacterium]|mgnify:CR=1 FL=1|nr:hypothetical protein [Clostridia bacterium]